MPRDFPDIPVKLNDISSSIEGTNSPISDSHDGYGWVAAPVSRRLESLLREQIDQLEKRLNNFESSIAEIKSMSMDITFMKHKIESLIKKQP